jgi:hypothetical protein
MRIVRYDKVSRSAIVMLTVRYPFSVTPSKSARMHKYWEASKLAITAASALCPFY